MSVTKSTVLARMRNSGISATAVADAAANEALEQALAEYWRHCPKVYEGTITTVADQQQYALPTGGIKLLACFWSPTSTAEVFSRANVLGVFRGEEWAGAADYHWPSLADIVAAKEAEWRRHYGGYGSQPLGDGGKVYLHPTPEEADKTVVVWYTKAPAWDDVPATHETLLLEGGIAFAVQTLTATSAATLSYQSYRGGSVSVTVGGTAKERSELSASLLKGWRAQLRGRTRPGVAPVGKA